MTNILTLNNFTLSLKTKQAIKIGLSFALVYIISLNFAWIKPFWAGLAVVVMAIAANGQNIYMGVMRAGGTVVAGIVALIIFALAAQDRWLFIGLICAWVFVTTYLMLKDIKRAYMWNVAGFVCIIILTLQPESSAEAFGYAVHRVLETTMGLIVYTLVAVFLWPETNINVLKQTSIDLLSTQIKLLKLDVADLNTTEGKETQLKLTKQQIMLLKTLQVTFYAKGSDSDEVRESMPLWEKFHHLSEVLMERINQLQNGVTGFSTIDTEKLLPTLGAYKQEIAARLNIALKLHSGDDVDYIPKEIKLEINQTYLDSLSSFEKIALAASKKELGDIDRLSREILLCTKSLFSQSIRINVDDYKDKESIYYFLMIDKDKVKSAFFASMSSFVGFLVYIYINPVGHSLWFMLPAIFGMMMGYMPHFKISRFIVPTIFTGLYSLFIYSVIMPHLSSYISLGILLGVSIGVMTYYLETISRFGGYLCIILLVSVDNHQIYDFAQQANTFLAIVVVYAFSFGLSYIVSASRPEKEALSMLHRYFKNAELLLSELRSDKDSFIKKIKIEHYSYELNTLPSKLDDCISAIDHTHFNENSPQKVGHLVANIYFLTTALNELTKSSRLSQSDQISKETHYEIHKWSKAIKKIFNNYSHDLDKDPSLSVQKRLKKHREKAEISINKHLTDSKLSKVNNQERAHFYQLIGSYQGLTEALIAYENVAHTVRLRNWKDEYFS